MTTLPTLAELDPIPYINDDGYLPDFLVSQIGVYAIFNQDNQLQYIGYSRNIYLSLKQHLVRHPQQCYNVKVKTIERPNRTILEDIKTAWIAENGSIPPGNAADAEHWNQPIQVKPQMSEIEIAEYSKLEPLGQEKFMKQVARRVEAEILEGLKQRGIQEEIRFNPKLKSSGLLDLK